MSRDNAGAVLLLATLFLTTPLVGCLSSRGPLGSDEPVEPPARQYLPDTTHFGSDWERLQNESSANDSERWQPAPNLTDATIDLYGPEGNAPGFFNLVGIGVVLFNTTQHARDHFEEERADATANHTVSQAPWGDQAIRWNESSDPNRTVLGTNVRYRNAFVTVNVDVHEGVWNTTLTGTVRSVLDRMEG